MLYSLSTSKDVTFVAEFPGLELENYLAPDLDNTTIELMGGQVNVSGITENTKLDTNSNILSGYPERSRIENNRIETWRKATAACW